MAGEPLLPDGVDVDLFKVSEAVWAREAKHGFAGLTDAERTFLCVWNLEAEVNNGGFEQFFGNSAGDYASETPSALRAVGADQMAVLLERAMQPFGPSGPPSDRDQRWEAMEGLPDAIRERWGELDSEFYELESPASELQAFVEEHRSHFYAP